MMLVHLSDLHFQLEELGKGGGPDRDVRNELVRDLERLGDQIPDADGILVTGDVAFAGNKVEYAAAREWLRDLCEVVGAEPENVWVVPGNHDIDQGALNVIAQDFRAQMRRTAREANASQLERFFAERIDDTLLGEVLLKPLNSYNEFALGFQCESTKDALDWSYDFTLNDGSILRLHGLNSVLLSNQQDNDRGNKLFLSTWQLQAQLTREKGVIHAVMCHHPPDWLFGQDTVLNLLNNRAALQFFGHKHVQRVEEGRDFLRVYSGALHPRRGDGGWDPRYNVLKLNVSERDEAWMLEITLWQRRWSPQQTCFVAEAGPDSTPAKNVRLRLPAWSPAPVYASTASDTEASQEATPAATPDDNPTSEGEDRSGQAMSEPSRSLVYRFFDLPYHERMQIIVQLGLLQDDDRDLPETKLLERVFTRVRERDLADDLSGIIDARLRSRRD